METTLPPATPHRSRLAWALYAALVLLVGLMDYYVLVDTTDPQQKWDNNFAPWLGSAKVIDYDKYDFMVRFLLETDSAGTERMMQHLEARETTDQPDLDFSKTISLRGGTAVKMGTAVRYGSPVVRFCEPGENASPAICQIAKLSEPGRILFTCQAAPSPAGCHDLPIAYPELSRRPVTARMLRALPKWFSIALAGGLLLFVLAGKNLVGNGLVGMLGGMGKWRTWLWYLLPPACWMLSIAFLCASLTPVYSFSDAVYSFVVCVLGLMASVLISIAGHLVIVLREWRAARKAAKRRA